MDEREKMTIGADDVGEISLNDLLGSMGAKTKEPPYPRSGDTSISQTIAEQVKAIPELVFWGTTRFGHSLYRQENGVGGHTWWSDEVGGGVRVWDTSLVDPITLATCLDAEDEIRRRAEREAKYTAERLSAVRARIAQLEEDNRKADGWGAAVGARSEEIGELKREERRIIAFLKSKGEL